MPRSWHWALVRVVAGVSWACHQVLGFIARQAVLDRCDADGASRFGKVLGMPAVAPTRAAGNVTFTGTNGTVMPEGTEVQRSDGWTYVTDVEGTIAAGTLTVAVTATVAGEDGDAAATTALTLTTPIAGVDSGLVVAAGGLSGGGDLEPTEDHRTRLLTRLRRPPHGGAAHDYVQWARAALETVDAVWIVKGSFVPGVPLPHEIAVSVFFTLEGQGAAVIPVAADVTAVQNALDLEVPEGAEPIATAPVGLALTLTIDPDAVDDTATKRALVTTALHELCARKNADRQRDVPSPPMQVGRARLQNSEMRTAIGEGMEHFDLTSVMGDGTGLSDVQLTASQAIYLGTVTWV